MNHNISNHVQIIGNLGRNPEIKTTPTGKKLATFPVAFNETYNNAEGHKVESTHWFNIVAWESLATLAEKYMVKGKQVAINGRLINRSWADKDGKKQYSIEIVCSDILLLGGGKKEE